MKIITTRTIKLVEMDVVNAICEYIEKYNPGVGVDPKIVKFKPGLPEHLELLIEQEEGDDAKKKSKAHAPKDEKKTPHKPEKLEPKAAMAALPSFGRIAPTQAALPLVGEEKGHAEAQPTVPASPPPSATGPEATEAKTPEPPPPPKGPSLFAAFTRPVNQ